MDHIGMFIKEAKEYPLSCYLKTHLVEGMDKDLLLA